MIDMQTRGYNGHKLAVALHDAGDKNIVIFCHGYRGASVGPSRFFVRAANKLEKAHISSLRFDQYGSGNSEGDFYDSSFKDWVATTKSIAEEYLRQGYRVALFGQSMGGATVIRVASELPELICLVAWVPDPNVEPFVSPESGYIEEGGQRVQSAYWQEAHDAHVAARLAKVQVPAYIFQCTDDEYVDEQNRNAILRSAQTQHRVDNLEGYAHSSWTYEQSEDIISKSVAFIIKSFKQ